MTSWRPKVAEPETRLSATLRKILQKAELAGAVQNALSRWHASCVDGCIEG